MVARDDEEKDSWLDDPLVECPRIVMIQPPSLPKISWDGEVVTLDWTPDGS